MQQVHIYHEVSICGYPSGEYSLDIAKRYGLRFSPVMQFGRITSLMPIDDIRAPGDYRLISLVRVAPVVHR